MPSYIRKLPVPKSVLSKILDLFFGFFLNACYFLWENKFFKYQPLVLALITVGVIYFLGDQLSFSLDIH